MLYTLLGAVSVSAVSALLVFLVRRHFWHGMPRWIMPATAGLAMIGFSIWNSYAWYGRITSHLADGVVVAATFPTRSPIEPWTYMFPRVQHFIAVNMAGRARLADRPDLVVAEVIEFQQFRNVVRTVHLFDCRGRRMGRLPAEEPRFDDAGDITGIDWAAPSAGAPLVATVCGSV
ncbi:hypothetical protein M1105_19325 [Limibaculum sp. FT325]|uniref:hypothetical protein n=1 Tax=Thermohalobaculum sediminis TaxID=2939436 RepID=UPI0020C1308E|nr:hypothetical protein [Limibaculum sediminis]MCL5779119.1 hypothetical protein [Limibaculum sediminis]